MTSNTYTITIAADAGNYVAGMISDRMAEIVQAQAIRPPVRDDGDWFGAMVDAGNAAAAASAAAKWTMLRDALNALRAAGGLTQINDTFADAAARR